MLSLSEEKAQAALLLWVALSRTVPAVCTSPPCQEMAQIHVATKSQASAWTSANFCQITKFLTRLITVLSLSQKIVHNHCCCPISAIILMTSKLEVILKIYRGSNKLSNWVGLCGGGRSPSGTSPPAQAVGAQVASGYMPGDTLSSCCSSVSFSYYISFCIAALGGGW